MLIEWLLRRFRRPARAPSPALACIPIPATAHDLARRYGLPIHIVKPRRPT